MDATRERVRGSRPMARMLVRRSGPAPSASATMAGISASSAGSWRGRRPRRAAVDGGSGPRAHRAGAGGVSAGSHRWQPRQGLALVARTTRAAASSPGSPARVCRFVHLHTDREPLVRIQAAARATGVPDNPHPQRPIGAWDGHRWIRWPTRGPVHGGRGRPVIRRCWDPRNSHLLPPSQNLRHRGRPGRQRGCHAPLALRAGIGLTIAAGSECGLLPMGATGPPHPVAVRPPGWRWSHPPRTRWYASGCRTGRHALGWPGSDAECCGRAAGPQPLTVRPPRPRKTAAASAASMTGTSRIARILTPGVYVDPAPLAARPSRLRRVSRWRQYRRGHDRDSSSSSRGICWPLVSFVNIANIDLRRGSSACSECSIRPRTRCWRAGRLIKSAPHPVSRRGADRGRRRVCAGPRSQPRSRSTRGPARGQGMACWCI
jgi:hypothetical protein